MNFASYFKVLAASAAENELDEEMANALYGAFFDGGLPELEMGALVAFLQARNTTLLELLGAERAITQRVTRLKAPRQDVRPILIPTYGATLRQPNLTALLALLLRHFEIPVLVHGSLEGHGGMATAYVLRALKVMPCASPGQAQLALERDLLAFVPTAVLSAGVAGFMSLRARLGLSGKGCSLPLLLDPFDGNALLLCPTTSPAQSALLGEFFQTTAQRALVFVGAEGEPFVDLTQRPALELFVDGRGTMLFDEEKTTGQAATRLPVNSDVLATAAWIKHALAGKMPLPHPLCNLLACCLYGSGYASDMHQAKAIAAMPLGNLIAA